MAFARLRRNVPNLKELKKSSAQKRKKLLLNAKPDLINTLCDCCLNAKKGTLKISEAQKKKLLPHASIIRELAKKGKSVKKRRQILLQRGGFLSSLLIPVLSFVAALALKNG